jgi:hypothetical protein
VDSRHSANRTSQCVCFPARRSRSRKRQSIAIRLLGSFPGLQNWSQDGAFPASQYECAADASRCSGVRQWKDTVAYSAARWATSESDTVAGPPADYGRIGRARSSCGRCLKRLALGEQATNGAAGRAVGRMRRCAVRSTILPLGVIATAAIVSAVRGYRHER